MKLKLQGCIVQRGEYSQYFIITINRAYLPGYRTQLPMQETRKMQVLIPGSGRSPGEGNGNPFQYSSLENSMDRGTYSLQSIGLKRVGHN